MFDPKTGAMLPTCSHDPCTNPIDVGADGLGGKGTVRAPLVRKVDDPKKTRYYLFCSKQCAADALEMYADDERY